LLNILKSDFYKLGKSKTFLICTLLSVGMSLLLVATMTNPEAADMFGEQSGIGALTGLLAMNAHLQVIAAFVTVFVTLEFRLGTIKNTISRGAGRVQVILSKFLVSSVASIIILLAFMLTIMLSGTILWGFDPSGIVTISGLIRMLTLQILITIAYTALFTFISIAFRNLAGALVTSFVYVAIFPFILGGLTHLFGGGIDFSRFSLEWAMANLATLSPAPGDILRGVIIALIWMAVALEIGMGIFYKRDVK